MKFRVKPGRFASFVMFLVSLLMSAMFYVILVDVNNFGLIGYIFTVFPLLIGLTAAKGAFFRNGLTSAVIEQANSESNENKLKEIEELLQKNLITEQEYQKKRKEILDEI